MQVYYIFSTEETILPTAWTNLQQHLRRRNRVVHTVSGNGFCFLNAVAKSLQVDQGIKIQLSEAINIIMQLLENHQNYVDFHTVSAKRDTLVTNSDMLLNEAMDVFNSRNYNNDVVDLLVTITADALGLDLYIYQNNRGNSSFKVFWQSNQQTSLPKIYT